MKYVLALLIMLIPSVVFGSPFLVCDPIQQSFEVTEFILEIDGQVISVPPEVLPDGTFRIFYDLAGITNGNHTIRAKAKNIWGESSWSAPFDFTSGMPTIPGGYRIIP
jgi:hypothetical protein